MDINKDDTNVEPGKLTGFEYSLSPDSLDQILVENIDSLLTIRESQKNLTSSDPFEGNALELQFGSSLIIDPDEGGVGSLAKGLPVKGNDTFTITEQGRKDPRLVSKGFLDEGRTELSQKKAENYYRELFDFFKSE